MHPSENTHHRAISCSCASHRRASVWPAIAPVRTTAGPSCTCLGPPCSRRKFAGLCLRLFFSILSWLRSGLNNFFIFSKLREARSRLYRRQILQVNTRWKALDEIYKIESFTCFCTAQTSIFQNSKFVGNFLICFRKFDWKFQKATHVTLFWNLSRNPDKIS